MLEYMEIGLKNKIKDFIETNEKFLTESLEILNKKPNSIEEITSAKKDLVAVVNNMKVKKKERENVEEMNKLLRQVAGQGLNLTNFSSKWENLDTAVSR